MKQLVLLIEGNFSKRKQKVPTCNICVHYKTHISFVHILTWQISYAVVFQKIKRE